MRALLLALACLPTGASPIVTGASPIVTGASPIETGASPIETGATPIATDATPVTTGADAPDATFVRGMTISCQTWGIEWGTDGFAAELDDLARLGVNWVSIHPYARIHADGTVSTRRYSAGEAPEWLVRPIREAHARGMSILVIPHLAYWGSPWTWRGEIDFEDPERLARFFETYSAWIEGVARAARDADGFCIGNETDRLVRHERPWRELVARVRDATRARLTYAANYDQYDKVPFWDVLDAIGVQAYFPLAEAPQPSDDELRRGWRAAIAGLKALSERIGKPVVCTELGYDLSLAAASRPWEDGRPSAAELGAACALQERCLSIALEEIGREREWLRGAFLWKWFVGDARRENFLMKTPEMRAVIARCWGPR